MMKPSHGEQRSILYGAAQVLLRNFWLKLLSLIFSVFFFVLVRGDRDVLFERLAKVRIITPPNMTVVGPAERVLNMSIRSQNTLFAIPPSERELMGEVKIIGNTPEKINIKLTKDHFPNLRKNYIIEIDRPYIEVETDKLMEKSMPVHVSFRGALDPAYEIDRVIIEPNLVKLTGPRQELWHMDSVNTVPVNIDGVSASDFSVKTTLDLSDKQSVQASEDKVRVTLKLKEKNKNFKKKHNRIDINS